VVVKTTLLLRSDLSRMLGKRTAVGYQVLTFDSFEQATCELKEGNGFGSLFCIHYYLYYFLILFEIFRGCP